MNTGKMAIRCAINLRTFVNHEWVLITALSHTMRGRSPLTSWRQIDAGKRKDGTGEQHHSPLIRCSGPAG